MDRLDTRRASMPVLLGLVLALTGLMSCGSSSPSTQGDNVDASTYTAVIGHFMPPPALDSEMLRVVYVAGLGATELSLEDQVTVIDGFSATHEVRFVDDYAAAVDHHSPGSPPKDEGVLIGVGRIGPDSPHNVRVEIYVDADRVEAQLVTVAYRQGEWVIERVEPVEPEVLVGNE